MKKTKLFEVSLINKAYSRVLRDTTRFYTSDTALEIGFKLAEPEYSFDSGVILLLNEEDQSLVVRDLAREGAGFIYTLEDDIIEHYGNWAAQLKFEKDGETYVSSPVGFTVHNDLYNNRPPKLTDVNNWERLKQSAKDLIAEMGDVVANESSRIEAEKQRVEGYQEVRNFIDNFEIGADAVGTENIKNDVVTPKKTTFINQSENLFNKNDSELITGRMIQYNGKVVDYAAGAISHKIKVKPNDVLTGYFAINRFGGSGKGYFYNESGAFISAVTPTLTGNVGTLTVPNNTEISYMLFNLDIEPTTYPIETTMLVFGTVYPKSYIPFAYKLTNDFALNEAQKAEVDDKIANLGNKLTNKIIVFDGDSIANAINDPQDGWAGRIATNNNMVYTNYAVDGGTITAGLMAGTNPRHWVSRSVANYRADADYIILEGGTNDADLLGLVGLGEVSEGFNDVLDDTTFTGALESTLKQVILKYPNKKIGFIVAHKMGSLVQQNHRKIFFDRVVEVCLKWGVPYINLWEKSYINPLIPELKTLYYSDYQHLTSAGYDIITPMIEEWLKTL